MQTHEDNSHRSGEFLRLLKERAKKIADARASVITAGGDDEQEISRWDSHGVQCRHLPDDEQGILRISIGGGKTPLPLNYCVIRGSISECIQLVEEALKALRECQE